MYNDDIEVRFSTKHLPFEYKWLEFRLIVNKELYDEQAIDLKKIIRDFNPKEVVIDTNGLGVGLGDEMIRTQYDEFGNLLPAYGFINDDNYKKVQPKDAYP